MTVLKQKYGCESQVKENVLCLPKHDWTDHLCERVSILSMTTGRIRFLIDLEGDEILLDCLRRETSKLPTLRLASYNYNTQTALVYYDPAKQTAVDVAAAVLKAVKDFGRRHGMCEVGEEHRHDAHLPSHNHDLKHDHSHDHSHDHKHDHKHDHDHDHDHGHSHHGDACGSDHGDCGHDHSGLETQAEVHREIVKIVGTGLVLGFFVWRRIRGVTPFLALGPMNTVGALLTIAAGYPIFKGGVNSLKKGRKLNDDTLISIAVAATLVMRENITGLSVVWLINIGRLLEAITLRNSREQIKGLLDLTPDEVWKIVKDAKTGKDTLLKTAVADIHLGDKLKVFKSERIALDGVVESGNGHLIESHLTGEPLPKRKEVGDRVFAGSIVESGEIVVRVESLANETVLAKIVHEVERLRDKKAPIEKYGQKFASTFVPVSLGISVVVFLLTRDPRRAITSLVIACPCAAGLATPTAVSASIGRAARRGILLKGGAHLEEISKIDTIVFDKTGTLTKGYPEIVSEEIFVSDFEAAELLRLTGLAEQYSTHPLARSIVKLARSRGAVIATVEEYELIEGKGVSANVDGHTVLVGSERLMRESGVTSTKKTAEQIKKLKEKHPSTFVYTAIDGKLAGCFIFEDSLRPEAKSVLARLQRQGVTSFILLSGDSQKTVDHVAGVLGIEEAHGDMLPGDKHNYIEKLQAAGRKVAMIGDGVNDAQALAAANVSLAMAASQCDLAIETADITLAREDLHLVPDTIDIAHKTMRTIKTNFVSSIGVNLTGLLMGASGNLSPFMAAIVHNLSTLVVVGNSMRLGFSLKKDKQLTSGE